MVRCFEVSTKRSTLYRGILNNSIYNRLEDRAFVCNNKKLFESFRVGDFFAISEDIVIKRIPKESFIIGEFSFSITSSTIK